MGPRRLLRQFRYWNGIGRISYEVYVHLAAALAGDLFDLYPELPVRDAFNQAAEDLSLAGREEEANGAAETDRAICEAVFCRNAAKAFRWLGAKDMEALAKHSPEAFLRLWRLGTDEFEKLRGVIRRREARN